MFKLIPVALAALLIVGCASPEQKAYKSTAAVNNERLDLIDGYKRCMAKVSSGKAVESDCESFLKASDALK